MRHSKRIVMVVVAALVAVAWTITPAVASETPPRPVVAADTHTEDQPALTDPSLATERAPDVFRVKLETTAGDVVIQINRSWAPHGADRFYNLVKIGFYDGVVFYRVIPNFMAQCGFHPDPAVSAAWSRATIPDDEITHDNTRGMVTFAQPARPNARTTQFFINVADNSYLKQHGAFAPFGRVISGMDAVDALYSGYGEGAPSGRGPSQTRIAREGNAYLNAEFPKLDSIKRAVIVDAPE